jgi:hypothetical protein
MNALAATTRGCKSKRKNAADVVFLQNVVRNSNALQKVAAPSRVRTVLRDWPAENLEIVLIEGSKVKV